MIQEFINYQKQVRGLSSRTCEEYEKELRAFAIWARPQGMRWSSVTKQDIDKHTAAMTESGHKPSTIKKRVTALRSIYNYMMHEGMINESPARWCQTPRLAENLPKSADMAKIDEYLESEAKTAAQKEMHIAVALMVETGVRLSELMNMQTGDFDKRQKCIKVKGKGSRERIVFYGKRSSQALNMYKKGHQGKIIETMTDVTLRWTMYKELGKYCKRIHPHQLRHTFATEMLNNGMNLKTLSVLMGHKNITTTEIYAKANASRLAKEYKQINL